MAVLARKPDGIRPQEFCCHLKSVCKSAGEYLSLALCKAWDFVRSYTALRLGVISQVKSPTPPPESSLKCRVSPRWWRIFWRGCPQKPHPWL